MNRWSSEVGPRRFKISTMAPPWAGRTPRRSGAGEASSAAAIGRSNQNQISLPCAAKCSLRSDSARMLFCHSSTAPQLPFFKICSAAHNASALDVGRSQSRFNGSTHQCRAAIACGIQGGWTSAIRWFRASRANTGCSSWSSPMPCCSSSSSVRLDCGHPPFGSSLSNTPCPVLMAGVRDRPSSLARHTSGRAPGSTPDGENTGATEDMESILAIEYCMNIQYIG